MPFGVVGKILMSRIEWNLFGKIWIQNVGDIDFEVFLPLKIQINSQKTRFWKEKSVEDVVTLGPTAQATLITIEKDNKKYYYYYYYYYYKKIEVV